MGPHKLGGEGVISYYCELLWGDLGLSGLWGCGVGVLPCLLGGVCICHKPQTLRCNLRSLAKFCVYSHSFWTLDPRKGRVGGYK